MDQEIDIWPDGVPSTYWRFDAVTLADDGNVIRFLGIQFEWEFVVAAIVGAVGIWLFARSAFNKPSFDPASYNYEVLRALSPSDLRGKAQVRNAYALYAGTLILIYVALTFFGKLILDLFNPVLSTAGLSFNAGNLDFTSPQWPITISLGMIGLIPMLKPVELLERGIRRMAHQRAGIPVHIHQRSADLRRALDETVEDAVEARLPDVPSWVEQALNDPSAVRRSVEALEELRLLRNWLMDERAHWPDATQRQRIGRLERTEIEESSVILEEIWALMAQDFDTAKAPTPETARLTEDQRLLAHRNHMIAKWRTLSDAVERHRDELIAILVVYAERDEDYDTIEDPALEKLIKGIFVREPAPPGPETALFWMMIPVFLLYFCFVWADIHPKLGALPPDSPSIAATFWTALLETARVGILFWLPVAAVMAVRSTKWEATERDWQRLRLSKWTGKMQKELGKGVASTLFLSLVGLLLLSMLWAALVSRDPERFAYLLKDSPIAFFWTFSTLAGIAVIQIVFVMFVVDAEQSSRLWKGRWLVGIVSALLAIAWKVAHFTLWLKAAGFDVPTWTLIRDVVLPNDGLNIIIYAFLALGSVTFLVPRRQGTGPEVHGSFIRTRQTAGAACVALSVMAADRAEAEDINVGFRADAEPFSFRVDRNGSMRFSGYVADLCYKIFATDAYSVRAQEVTADNRFEKLNSGEIDLLCDPVTLRFSLDDGRAEGVFSPIVFVTGVSYLWRQITELNPRPMLIAFVDGTSAREVAVRACESDHFRWRNTSRNYGPEDCRVRNWQDCQIEGDASDDFGGTYRVCRAPNHSELIEWFCSDDAPPTTPSRWSKAYFGDQDIIRGKLDAWLKAGNRCDNVERHRNVYTYEPYALVISRKPEHIDLVAHVQRRIYEIFSNRPEALGLFISSFPNKQMSEPLANLFLLNAVERPECLQFNPGCAPQEGAGASEVAEGTE